MKNDFENWKDFPTILSNQSINCYYLKYKDEEVKKGDILYFQNDDGNFETIIVNKLEITPIITIIDINNKKYLLTKCKKNLK